MHRTATKQQNAHCQQSQARQSKSNTILHDHKRRTATARLFFERFDDNTTAAQSAFLPSHRYAQERRHARHNALCKRRVTTFYPFTTSRGKITFLTTPNDVLLLIVGKKSRQNRTLHFTYVCQSSMTDIPHIVFQTKIRHKILYFCIDNHPSIDIQYRSFVVTTSNLFPRAPAYTRVCAMASCTAACDQSATTAVVVPPKSSVRHFLSACRVCIVYLRQTDVTNYFYGKCVLED